MLPHRDELASGIHVAGFSYQYGNANCGWIELDDHILLVDLPRGTPVSEFLNQVSKRSGKSVKRLVLTHLWSDPDWGSNRDYDPARKRWYDPGHRLTSDPVIPIVQALLRSGVQRIITSPEIGSRLVQAGEGISASPRTATAAPGRGDGGDLILLLFHNIRRNFSVNGFVYPKLTPSPLVHKDSPSPTLVPLPSALPSAL